MKKLLALLLTLSILATAALLLASCDEDDAPPPTPAPSPEHDCTFSTEWSSNATHHWHACTGENCNEKKDKGEHEYEAGSCTVCGSAQSSAVRYQSVCNNIAASIAAFTPPATAALAATGGSEPVLRPLLQVNI